MTETNDKLMGILAQVLLLESENITDDIRRKDYEPWDSMAHLVLISEIENEFGIFFEDEEVIEIWTVADVKKAVASKI
ncbi:MAG: acyl carrier protein [Candidatus Thorarchaeota archaeon]